MNKVFIGGSIKLSKINNEVKQRIDNIINNGYTILIGDANGIDKSVQKYLFSKNYLNVLVFCSGDQCRNNIGNWKVTYVEANNELKGRHFYTFKDIQMAQETDFGMMIWDGRSTGTFNNIMNLIKFNKKILVYFSPKKVFYTISNIDDFESICSEIVEKNLFSDFRGRSREISAVQEEI
jgi:hypothetical protein